jgi:hypothetical protein
LSAGYPNWNAAMGARSKKPPRSRREERPARLQPEAGRVSTKGADTRAKPTKAERRSERAATRLAAIERNASSIPPAAIHDVFDVSVPPPARSPSSSLPPPLPPRGDRRKADRHATHRPAPHPPRPSKPPVAELPRSAPRHAVEVTPESGVELSPNEYEFASDSFGVPPLAAPRTDAPVELRVELPPERFDEQRPARIPYRAIALTSAALMVVVIVAGFTRPKDERLGDATALRVAQKPLAAALTEGAGRANSNVPAVPIVQAVNAEPVVSTASAADTSSPTAAANVALKPEPTEPLASAAVASPAPPVRVRARADIGVAAAGFDTALASSSITAAFARASSCLKDGDPRQPATILLTYAPSGRVTTAVLSGPYSGTAVGGCIAATLRTARVPPFAGDYVTVKRTSVLK